MAIPPAIARRRSSATDIARAATALRQTARRLADMPQEAEYLQRAIAAYRQALAQYEQDPGLPRRGEQPAARHASVDDLDEPHCGAARRRRTTGPVADGGDLHHRGATAMPPRRPPGGSSAFQRRSICAGRGIAAGDAMLCAPRTRGVTQRLAGPPSRSASISTRVADARASSPCSSATSTAGRRTARGPRAVCVSGAGRRRRRDGRQTSAPSSARALPPTRSIALRRATRYRDVWRDERARAKRGRKAAPRIDPRADAGAELPRSSRCSWSELRAVRGALVLLWARCTSSPSTPCRRSWRRRGIAGDRVLLAIAHVLTAVGFAADGQPRRIRCGSRRCSSVTRRGSRRACRGRRDLARQRPHRAACATQLPAARRRAAAVVRADPLRHRTVGQQREGEPRSAAADRGDPASCSRCFSPATSRATGSCCARCAASRSAAVSVPRWLNVPRVRYVAAGARRRRRGRWRCSSVQKDLGPALMLAVVFLAVVRHRARHGRADARRRRRCWPPGSISATGSTSRRRSPIACACGSRRGTTRRAAAIRSRRRCGRCRPAAVRHRPRPRRHALSAGRAHRSRARGGRRRARRRGAVRRGRCSTPRSIWRALATARRGATDYGFFLAIVLTLFLAVPVLLMAARHARRGAAHRRRDAVSELRRVGDGRRTSRRSACSPRIRSDAAPAGGSRGVPRRRCAGSACSSALAAVVLLVVAAARAGAACGRGRRQAASRPAGRRHAAVPVQPARSSTSSGRFRAGSIVDREGLPLATDDAALLRTRRGGIRATGHRAGRRPVPIPRERCYPLGGRAFHLLGDRRTRPNWSASNTSFVERDSEARLRGFDDHQTPVRDRGRGDGAPKHGRCGATTAICVPLLRHRHDPDHPAVQGAAGAAARPAADDRRAAAGARRGDPRRLGRGDRTSAARAPPIVLDPDTGDLLASVSYPWPVATPTTDRRERRR